MCRMKLNATTKHSVNIPFLSFINTLMGDTQKLLQFSTSDLSPVLQREIIGIDWSACAHLIKRGHIAATKGRMLQRIARCAQRLIIPAHIGKIQSPGASNLISTEQKG